MDNISEEETFVNTYFLFFQLFFLDEFQNHRIVIEPRQADGGCKATVLLHNLRHHYGGGFESLQCSVLWDILK